MHWLLGRARLREVEHHGLQPAGLQVLHYLNDGAPAGMGFVRRG